MDWLTLLNILVAAFIAQAGDRDFKQRERAGIALARLADIAIEQLKAAEKHSDPEIAARCRPIVDAWWRRNAHLVVDQLLSPGWASFPLIYSLWDEWGQHADEAAFFMNLAGAGFHANHPDNLPWTARSEATRLWMIVRLQARLPCAEILQSLADTQRRFCKEHGHDVPPRWRMPK